MNFTPYTPDFLQARQTALQHWFSAQVPQLADGPEVEQLQPVSGDASFRRYFRGRTRTRTWILMDAPPEREDSRPFVTVARQLATGGVCVPVIHAWDQENGFMCLDDFGSTLLWEPLQQALVKQDLAEAGLLYQSAMQQLVKIQRCDTQGAATLPSYDQALLMREMALFSEWFCSGIMQLAPEETGRGQMPAVHDFLVDAACAQPQVFVHRDFHSRNLMYRQALPLGVLDFQDAVVGPATYDLVSLLRDCYIAWPDAQVKQWAENYRQMAVAAGVGIQDSAAQFERDFDLMGVQRHLKAVGIFSRLWLRDGKPGYLKDIPRTLGYIVSVASAYPELAAFTAWLRNQVQPGLEAALARALAQGQQTI
jgi:aminoglycoside/choline kinase family phosphotransferase